MKELVYNGTLIRDQGEELNLTDMWMAAGSPEGRRPADWLRSADAQRFIEFLAETMGRLPEVRNSHFGLVRTVKGGSVRGITWAHWQIGMAYAKYLRPDFHVWCNTVVRERMEGVPVGVQRQLDDRLSPVEDRLAVLVEQIAHLLPRVNPKLHAVSDRMTVREALDRAGAVSKGRHSLRMRVTWALQRQHNERGVMIETDPHAASKTLLFRADLVNEFMAHTGCRWVAEHNAAAGAQYVLPFTPKGRRRPAA